MILLRHQDAAIGVFTKPYMKYFPVPVIAPLGISEPFALQGAELYYLKDRIGLLISKWHLASFVGPMCMKY